MCFLLLKPGNPVGIEVRACHGLEYLLLNVIAHNGFLFSSGHFPDLFHDQGKKLL